MLAIGLMSGTSMDGIDVALIETEGAALKIARGANGYVEALGPTGYRPYSDEERALLRQALTDAEGVTDRADRPGCLAEAERMITQAHAEAVEAFLAAEKLDARDIAVIGFHGQTVLHRPSEGITLQIGDGQRLADRLRIPVVYDLRAADMAADGQGAPLVPAFHRALAEASGFAAPLAVLNIGGVANVTLIAADGSILAFDTGPGNALIDDWMRERTGRPLDDGGRTAARGRPDGALLAWLLMHPFFVQRPPKSLDRNWFSHRLAGQLSTEDGAATLTAFTAQAAARALDHTRETPQRWIVAGGGARNGELMRLLKHHLRVEIATADSVGWSSAFLEAQAFAYLAVLAKAGEPFTFPSTTGVARPTSGGILAGPR